MKTRTFKITQEGFDRFVAELKELRTVKRPIIIARLQKAREMGDLSENSEYTSAKEAQRTIDSRIIWLEIRTRNAEIVEKSENNDIVSLGSTVTLEKDGEKFIYEIVGELEADIVQKKLSTSSPIGRAMMGKKVGDCVSVVVPAGTIVYNLIKIQ